MAMVTHDTEQPALRHGPDTGRPVVQRSRPAPPRAAPPPPATGYACPACAGPIGRVPRTLLDRLIAVLQLTPLRRWRCRSRACSWSGLLDTRAIRGRHDGNAGFYSGYSDRI